MMLAQQLYEGGIEIPGLTAVGLITYMRTDSVRVSDEAVAGVRDYIKADLRRRLPAREAERLQDEVRRAGRARGDPADLAAARSGNRAGVPDARISTRSTA